MNRRRQQDSYVVEERHCLRILEQESVNRNSEGSQHPDEVVGEMGVGTEVHVVKVVDRLLSCGVSVDQNRRRLVLLREVH